MSYTSLIIEQSVPVRNEIVRIASETGLFSNIHFSSSVPDSRRILEQFPVDLLLCGWDADTAQQRVEVLNHIAQNEEWADIPAMAFIRQSDPELKILALDHGLADCHEFMTSPREVAARMRLQIGMKERTRKLREEKNQLARLARTDSLTGIYNRAHFDETIETELSRCRRTSQPLGLLLLDLDHFKSVNDTYGHPCGDMVLQIVAKTIRQTTRCTDIVCRYGGEEFAILLPDTSVNNAYITAEKIRQAIAALVPRYGQEKLHLTVSIGISGTRGLSQVSAADIIREADQALYQGKQRGRNRSVVYRPATPVLAPRGHAIFPRAAMGFA